MAACISDFLSVFNAELALLSAWDGSKGNERLVYTVCEGTYELAPRLQETTPAYSNDFYLGDWDIQAGTHPPLVAMLPDRSFECETYMGCSLVGGSRGIFGPKSVWVDNTSGTGAALEKANPDHDPDSTGLRVDGFVFADMSADEGLEAPAVGVYNIIDEEFFPDKSFRVTNSKFENINFLNGTRVVEVDSGKRDAEIEISNCLFAGISAKKTNEQTLSLSSYIVAIAGLAKRNEFANNTFQDCVVDAVGNALNFTGMSSLVLIDTSVNAVGGVWSESDVAKGNSFSNCQYQTAAVEFPNPTGEGSEFCAVSVNTNTGIVGTPVCPDFSINGKCVSFEFACTPTVAPTEPPTTSAPIVPGAPTLEPTLAPGTTPRSYVSDLGGGAGSMFLAILLGLLLL